MRKSIIGAVFLAGLTLSACGSSSGSYLAGYNMIASKSGVDVLVSSDAQISGYCQQAVGLGWTNGYDESDYLQGCRDAMTDWWSATNGGTNYNVPISQK